MKEGIKKVRLNDILKRHSRGILKVLDIVKRSVHKEDKAILKELEQMSKYKLVEEKYMDNDRVKNNSKRITVISRVSHISYEFSVISTIKGLTYLNSLIEMMSKPNPENPLEQEALDLLNLHKERLQSEKA